MLILSACTFGMFQGANAQVEESITFQHAGLTVQATFAHPGTGGPYPSVFLMPGTGANDRDVTLTLSGGNSACLYPGLVGETLKPFKDLSDALVAGGFGVLRYDKLEHTYSGAALGTITFEKLWLVAESGLPWLRSRPDVDMDRISLIGHSEGSTIAPYVALRDEGVAAIVSLAGPRAPLDSLLAYQFPYIAGTCGGDVADANVQAQQILSYFQMVRDQTWTGGTPDLFGVSPQVWYRYISMADSVAINYDLVDRPLLFLGCGDDFNVPPAELTRFQNELGTQAEYGSFTGLNHYMTTASDPFVSPLLTDSVVSWLSLRMATVGVAENHAALRPSVHPNPATGKAWVHTISGGMARLVAPTGATLRHIRLLPGSNELPLEGLPDGVYHLQLEGGLPVRLIVAK